MEYYYYQDDSVDSTLANEVEHRFEHNVVKGVMPEGSRLQEGVDGFGPGDYSGFYSGEGDRVYWGRRLNQNYG